MLTIREFVTKNHSQYKTNAELVKACAKACKVTERAVRNKLSHLGLTAKPDAAKPGVGLTEDQLRQKHDLVFMVQKAARGLATGSFIPESEFVREIAGIRGGMYRHALGMPEFEKYKGRAGTVTYWGNPASIKKMKDEKVLQ